MKQNKKGEENTHFSARLHERSSLQVLKSGCWKPDDFTPTIQKSLFQNPLIYQVAPLTGV
jgi:hypothetical protein